MKKIMLAVLMVSGLGALNAQKLNDKGLYVNDHENSAILFHGEYFNGILSDTKNGIKSELTVKEGVIEGPAKYYYASGKLMESGFFTKGQKDQKWVRYNENGTTAAIAFYNLGKKTGTWLVYDENGNKRFEMHYTDGEKTGIWTNWDEHGAIAGTKDYNQVN